MCDYCTGKRQRPPSTIGGPDRPVTLAEVHAYLRAAAVVWPAGLEGDVVVVHVPGRGWRADLINVVYLVGPDDPRPFGTTPDEALARFRAWLADRTICEDGFHAGRFELTVRGPIAASPGCAL